MSLISSRYGLMTLITACLFPLVFGLLRWKRVIHFLGPLFLYGIIILIMISSYKVPYTGYDALGYGLAKGILLILGCMMISLIHSLALLVLEFIAYKRGQSIDRKPEKRPSFIFMSLLIVVIGFHSILLIDLL